MQPAETTTNSKEPNNPARTSKSHLMGSLQFPLSIPNEELALQLDWYGATRY